VAPTHSALPHGAAGIRPHGFSSHWRDPGSPLAQRAGNDGRAFFNGLLERFRAKRVPVRARKTR